MVEGMPTFHPQQEPAADEPAAVSPISQLPPSAPSPAPITDIVLASLLSPPTPAADYECVHNVSATLGLFIARNPTGQPILAVGVSNFASSRPPLSQTATLTSSLEQLDLRQSTEDGGDESGVFLWLGRDPHPVDELSLPQHAQPYVSEVAIVETDVVDEWRLKGWQTVALSQSQHLALRFTSPSISPQQQSSPSASSDSLPPPVEAVGRGLSSSAAGLEDKRALVVGGWRVGDMIDALDTVNTWLEARVVDVNVRDEQLYIHFDGWADKWNEWIPAKSKRLARYRTNTGIRGVDRPFNLKLEAHGLHQTIARLRQIRATLEAKAKEVNEASASTSPLPPSHAFYPLSAPLSTLLSVEDYHFLSAGDNFKYIGHVVNASVDAQNTHLLHDSIAFLQHNTTLLSYTLATEPTLQAGWCEMLARLMGGGPHHLYNAYGTRSDDSEGQVEELQARSSGTPDAASVQQADGAKVVYAVREVIGKRTMQQQGMSAGLGVVSDKEKGGGLMSVIIVSLLNRFGREGGFAALQRHFAQLQAQAQTTLAATTVPQPTAAQAVGTATSVAAVAAPAAAPTATTTTAPAAAVSAPSTSTTSPTASLYPLAYVIRGLAAIRLVLDSSFAHSLVSSLTLPVVVRHQLHTITDDELKQLDRQVWRTVIQDIQSLLLTSTVADVKGCIEFAETMNLHVALRMIQAQVLATRIDGIQQLDAYVVRASGSNAAQFAANQQSSILTPAYLASWLEDNRVVESLLGRDSHEQIVKRSPSILKFLATQHKLQSRHLELLYQAMQGKHEGVVRIVYELLCDLASVLSEEMLDVVFGRLQEKPLSECREFDLQVVKAFTLNAVRNRQEAALREKEGAGKEKEKDKSAKGGKDEKERKWYGLSILWDLIQDSTIAAPIASLASQSLASLLAQPDFRPQLSAYLDRCLSTLGGAKAADPLSSNTVSALQLAQLIIQQQPEVAARGVSSRGDLIVALESDRKVLSLLVDSIVSYEKAVLGGGAGSTVTDELVVAGHTHLAQLQTRFAFLSFLLYSSPPSRISLQQSHIDLLWSTFITPTCPPTDQSRLFNWLTSAVLDRDPRDSREVLILPTKLTRVIFRDYLCNTTRFDYSSITVAGYECFESYFVFTGRETDALYTARRDNITVIQWRKLDGVDSLWQLVTLCKDKAVLTAASTLLTTLYLRLDMLAPPRDKRAYLKQFVEKCMAHIAAAVQGDSKHKVHQAKDSKDKAKAKATSAPLSLSSSQELTIYSDSTSFRLSSLVFLLDLFLIRLSRGELMDRPRYSTGAIVRATWKSQTKMFDARVKQINRDGTYHLEYSDGDVDERTPERNLHPVNRDEAIAREKEREKERERREYEARGLLINDDGDDSDAVYPRNLLAQSAHFEVLFRLLGQTNAMLGQQVSELLARMPVNAELAQHIRQLGMPEPTVDAKGKPAAPLPAPDWNSLLPFASVPKLLYTLRVIRSYAIPPTDEQSAVGSAANGDVDAARAGVQRWQELFVSRGGFKHLYALLMMNDAKLDEWMADALAHKCLGMLLELLHAFLQLQSVRPTVLEAIDGVKLAGRFLAVAQAAIQLASKEEPVPTPNPRQPSQQAASAPRPSMMGPTLPPVSTLLPVSSRQSVVPTPPSNPAHELLGRLARTSLLSLHALLQASPTLLTSALSSPAWDVLLSDGILSPLVSCRLSLMTSLLTLCFSFAAVANFCLPRLLARLPALDNNTASVVGHEYFVLLQKLIDKHKHATTATTADTTAETQNGSSTTTAPATTSSTPPTDSASSTQPGDIGRAPLYDPVQLVLSINSKIAQQPIVEATHMQHDQMLLGFLSLIRLLLQSEAPAVKQQLGTTLIPHLFACLFDTPTSETRAAQLIQPPKFKAGKTRDMAFAILNELCIDCPPNALALASQLLPFHYQGHTSQPDTKDWAFEPRVEEKSLTGYLGLVNLGCTCFPEYDTRVLTDSGYLFLSDIEARAAAGQRVLYACYDTSTQSIVYRPGQLVFPAAPPTRWVDFTHAGTRRLWDATSDDYGSTVAANGMPANYLTLRTTPDHDMYVQLCTRCEEDGHESYQPRLAGNALIPPHKQPAQELAPGYHCDCVAAGRTCTHGYSHYRMYTGAAGGLHTPADVISLTDRDPLSPVVALGLHSKDELDAFLELFGYWLGNGSISYDTGDDLTSPNAVCFALTKDSNCVYLHGLLARLHFKRGQHFTSCEIDWGLEVRITEPRWVRFFDDKSGVKDSTQRRPSSASSVSAAVSVAVASSTRTRSFSASVSVGLVADYSDDDREDMSPCDAELVEDEVEHATSVKSLPDWTLFRLGAGQLRLVIEGLRQADGSSTKAAAAQRQSAAAGGKAMQGEQQICTSSFGFRDQLIHACVHAGYSAYFTLNTAAGEVRGYNAVPNDKCIHTQEEMETALRVNSTRQFKPVRNNHDSWSVRYSEVISELLPAQDVRFDGTACRGRQEKELTSKQAIEQQQTASIALQPADLYDQKRDGRVWCVNVQHEDRLIFVQRAHCNASGIVTKVGRTMIVGNCYMNAPLQQLFMIPAFRSALLSINVYKDGGDPFNPHESLLYQMQYLFGQLQESEQQAVSPLGFCHAFKDLDGKPTDVRVQDDSGGFVQKLLDRLCMSCKATPFEHSIPRILGGELCHELIGLGDCTHYRDRSEEFYGLQVEVQNKRTLTDSLAAFIEGEVLEGGNQYKCEECNNKKVDTLKRTCIRKLPPTLFFTLKRFQLDYNTMETIKLNDRLEFPHYIDMRPYCKVAMPTPADRTTNTAKAAEGKEEGDGKANEQTQSQKADKREEAEEERGAEYYQYVLRGVVVHTGSANGGHYYSFIQERGENGEDADGRWLKMNDSVVSFFDPADIPDECFGGVEEAPALSRGVANKDGQAQVFERYRNAYLVFYDRVKQPVESIKKANESIADKYNATVAPTQLSIHSLSKAKATITKSPSSTYLSALNGSSKVVRTTARLPPAMHEAIWAANMAYFRDKAVYDRSYFDFIHKLVVDCAVTPRRRKSTAITVLSYKPGTTEPVAEPTEANPADGDAAGSTAGDSLAARLSSLSLSDGDDYYQHQLTQLATRFFLLTFARSRNKDLLPQWSTALRSLYERDVLSSAWLLHQFTINNGAWVQEYLWECTDQNVKRAVAELLCVAIGNVVPLSAEAFREGAPKPVLWRYDQPLGTATAWLSYTQSDESSYGVNVGVEFAHTLVQLLNQSSVYWREFDHYFRVFSALASSSSQCALWLLREHRLLGRLLDFFLCDASLCPTLNQLPADPLTGQRLMMRDMHSSPEWNNFIALTSTLIQHSKQPATLPITLHSATPIPPQLNPYTDRTLVDLSEEEMALLVYPDINNGFLVHLLQLAATRKKGQIVSAAICHLCRNNEAQTQLLVQCIRRGLEWFDFDSIRSYFRVLTALVLLKDDLQAVRVAAIMSMLLDVIRAQLRFWKISDFCLDHLIRIAKLSPLALQYIHSHPSDLEPLLNFTFSYPDPPTTSHRYQMQSTAAGVQLFKPREHYSVSRPQSAFEAYGLPTRTKLAVLGSLMRGGEVDDAAGAGSDSDQDFSERVLEEGQWIDALDTASKWLCAQVVSVAGSKVLVRYSGWCFAPETRLLLADGGEISAKDVMPQHVGSEGATIAGTVLLDEHGQPTPVTAVDRGYVEVESVDGGRVQRVPRADHPAKDMYRFEVVGHGMPPDVTVHPPLVVSADHIIELVSLMRPTVLVCNDGGSYGVHHWQLNPDTQFMYRSSFGCLASEELANECAADLPYPVRWSPRASLFYAYLHSSTSDDDKRSWSMYQPSALSAAPQLQSVTPLAFTAVGRFRALLLEALYPVTEQRLTSQLLHRLAWLIGLSLAVSNADQATVAQRGFGSQAPDDDHGAAINEIVSIAHAVHALLGGSPLAPEVDERRQQLQTNSRSFPDWQWLLHPMLDGGHDHRFGRLLVGLGVGTNKHVPMAILADSVDVRRHCLAGLVDGSGWAVPESRQYVLSCPQTASSLMDGITHLARGLGYAVGGWRPTTYETQLGKQQPAYQCSILGVPDFTDPFGLPVLLSHKRIKAPQRIEPRTYSYSCLSPGKDGRILAAVAALGSHDYVGITVPHGAMLSASSLVVHNSDKWNEWIEMSSTRIQELGRKTSKKQIEERLRRPPAKDASPSGTAVSPAHAR